jgi:hypothetical protein
VLGGAETAKGIAAMPNRECVQALITYVEQRREVEAIREFYASVKGIELWLMTEVDEDAPEVAIIFLDAVIECANMRLIEKPKYMLFELAAAFARNDLHQGNPLRNGLLHDPVQLGVNLIAPIIDVV